MRNIRQTLEPSTIEMDQLLAGLKKSTAPFLLHGDGYQTVAFFIDGQEICSSGLYGYALFDWFYVEFLNVEQELRGQGLGAQLLAEAERWSRERGLAGMWLHTLEFQARGFYEKQGFVLVATLVGRPVGSATHIMEKRF